MFIFYFSVILLIAFSAVCSAAETAVTGSSPGKIYKFKTEGNPRATLVVSLLRQKSRLISSLLVANTLVNIFSTSIVTSMLIEMYGEQGTAYATFVMSLLIIIFAEVLPKAFAVISPEQISMALAPALHALIKLLMPITSFLELIIRVTAAVFNLNKDQLISPAEEMRGLIEHQHEEGNFIKSDRDMLGGVLDLSSIAVSEIMTHRSNMSSIDASLPLEDITKQAINTPYTRIPLWREDKDNIVGVLHLRTLLKALHANKFSYNKLKLSDFVTEPWFIPESVSVKNQLFEFRKKRNHFAIVVDEYGAIRGIITLEDALEEIVGQIEDEIDPKYQAIIKTDKNYIIEGKTPIRDVNREFSWNLPDENVSTIAGLIMHETGIIPEEGQEFMIYDLKIKILRRQANKIKTLSVEPLNKDLTNKFVSQANDMQDIND